MFKIGDKIVYPMHGAGTIESIEEKEMFMLVNKDWATNQVNVTNI